MLVDVVKPLTVRFPHRTIDLDPGYPVELSRDEAAKLLEQLSDKVLAHVNGVRVKCGGRITWKSSRQAYRCAVVEILTVSDSGLWAFVGSRGIPRWVNERIIVNSEKRHHRLSRDRKRQ